MTACVEAIHNLKALGYSVTLKDGNMRYEYRGKGNPQPGEIKHFLEILKAQKEEILRDPHFLIEQTLEEINSAWIPGALEWMKGSRPEDWKKMIVMEVMINEKGLTGDIEGLRKVLKEYRDSMLGMVKAFTSQGEQANLFSTLKQGGKTDGERDYSHL